MVETLIPATALATSTLPLALIIYKIRNRIKHHPYSAESIFVAAFFIFYFFDTLYSTANYTNSFTISGLHFRFTDINLAVLAVYYCTSAALVIAILFTNSEKRNKKISESIIKTSKSFSHPIPLNISRALIYISLFWLAGKILTFGFREYFENLAVRALIFSDTTTENALISASISIYSLIISCRYAANPRPVRLLMDAAPLLAAIILTGARATLVEFAFIFLFINNYHSQSFRLNKKSIAALALSAIALTQFAMSTRIHSDTNVEGMLSAVFETEQIPQSENGLNILEKGSQQNTIPTSLIAFMPRSILESIGIDKGYGANADYTEEFVAYRWIDQNSQISLGGLNELLYNSNPITALFTVIVGAFLVRLIIEASCRSSLMVFLTPALSWSAFQFLRGDLYHTTNKIFTYITALLLFAAIIKIVEFIRAPHRKLKYEKSTNHRTLRI